MGKEIGKHNTLVLELIQERGGLSLVAVQTGMLGVEGIEDNVDDVAIKAVECLASGSLLDLVCGIGTRVLGRTGAEER